MQAARGPGSVYIWDSFHKAFTAFKKERKKSKHRPETKNMISLECDSMSCVLWNDLLNFPKQTEVNENSAMFPTLNWVTQGIKLFSSRSPYWDRLLCVLQDAGLHVTVLRCACVGFPSAGWKVRPVMLRSGLCSWVALTGFSHPHPSNYGMWWGDADAFMWNPCKGDWGFPQQASFSETIPSTLLLHCRLVTLQLSVFFVLFSLPSAEKVTF